MNKPVLLSSSRSRKSFTEFLAGGGEMGAQIRAKDWLQTPLGEPETWPQSLKTVIRIMLDSRYAMWMAWGPQLTFFCNDAYKPTLGVKGNWALGSPSDKVWEEIWPDIGPRIRSVFDTASATWDEDLLLFLERSEYPEETYHTFSYSPVPGDDGRVAGMLCVVTEETVRVIGERRLAFLRELAAELATTKTEEGVLATIQRRFVANRYDLPLTLVYLLEEGGRSARLGCSTGIPEGHPAAPSAIALGSANALWPLPGALGSAGPTKVGLGARFDGLATGAWDKPPREAVVLPVAAQGQELPAGFLIAGLNPYRPYDAAYEGFIELVAGQIASSLGNARAYEEERRRAEALAEIDRAKTAFFSNVSHEFRTPLTLMLGPLEALLARPADSENDAQRTLIDTAHRNGMRLLRLVNSLLDFSRIEAGRVQARFEPTELAAFTAELASTFRSAIDQAGLILLIEHSPLPAPVYVDRDMWEKIVLNLLSNAFKFTFEGEIGVKVAPSADASMVELVVRDTGTGIPQHELPHLFERFHRVEGAKGRTFEGSGIGLALVQELVKLHGGSITVESRLGRGTTFTTSIPFGTAHLAGDRIRETDPAAVANRAQAYLEEALSWLPREGAAGPARASVSRSPLDDFDAPVMRAGATSGRVLLADDNADMRDYLRRLLLDQDYEVEAVLDGEAALAAARRRAPDLILSDVMMPVLDGFALLRAVRADPGLREIPVVLLSARAGEEARVEGIDAGADDYLTKPFSARELLARVSTNLQMARTRREAMEAVRARTAELETVLETVPTGVWFTRDADASHASGNRQAAALLRLPVDGNVALSAPAGEYPILYRVFRNGVEAAPQTLPLQRAARGEEVREDELEVRFADGTSTLLLMQAMPLRDGSTDHVIGAVAAAVDITARKQAELAVRELNERLEERVAAEVERRRRAEAELRQAQKMEAIGQLTGGVAHDMNNLLLVIQASLERLERQIPSRSGDGVARALALGLRGTERAAALTRQLLAFARRQPLDPKPVDPNRLVSGISDLLRRTLGEAVPIETVFAGGLWRTFADSNQIESAILNLAVNARDAMPEGGRLTIETANTFLDEAYAAAHGDVVPGQYVMIAVSDTGTGMTREIVEKAFEPFFTTKEPGRGTGLGLSQVYGFVKQSGGHVKIYSELGQGTTVKIYLPRYIAETGDAIENAASPEIPFTGSSEVILVVEDDDDVRAHSVESLRELGYQVIEAPDAAAALRVIETWPSIRLLFTDVGLPDGMNGRQLADEARRRRPNLKVLFTTGYARNAIVHHGRLDPGVELIVKPYTYAALAAKIRRILDGGGDRAQDLM